LNGHVVDDHLTVILTAWAHFILDMGVVEELVAATTNSDLNLSESFLNLNVIESVHVIYS
jgi:hypothetical protein